VTQFMGYIWADGAASVGIGVILTLAAAGLAYETKSLLTGEAASTATVANIRRMVLAAPAIKGINELRTVHFGPYQILANISVDFHDATDLTEIEATISRLDRSLRSEIPDVAHVFIETAAREAETGAPFGVSRPSETG